MSHSDDEESLRRPLAYREESFLQSAESRPLRILSEYLWPLTHFRDEKIQDTMSSSARHAFRRPGHSAAIIRRRGSSPDS